MDGVIKIDVPDCDRIMTSQSFETNSPNDNFRSFSTELNLMTNFWIEKQYYYSYLYVSMLNIFLYVCLSTRGAANPLITSKSALKIRDIGGSGDIARVFYVSRMRP